jgi:hypothetical protein
MMPPDNTLVGQLLEATPWPPKSFHLFVADAACGARERWKTPEVSPDLCVLRQAVACELARPAKKCRIVARRDGT